MQCFPNLATIEIPSLLAESLHVQTSMRGKYLLAILKGEYDVEIRDALQQDYSLTFAAQEQIQAISRLVISTSSGTRFAIIDRSKIPRPTIFYQVFLKFDVIAYKCHLAATTVLRDTSGKLQVEDKEHVLSILEQGSTVWQRAIG